MPAKKPTSKELPKVAKKIRVKDLAPAKDAAAKVMGGAMREELEP